MNLKTLLQSICFCDTCNWKITRFGHSLCIYPSKHSTLNYMFSYHEIYIGHTIVSSRWEKPVPKEHIKYIINNGLSNYFDKYKI